MNTKNMEELYQKAIDILTAMIPEEWYRISLYAEVREGYRKVFYYYTNSQNNSATIPMLY
ncbi:immunity protein YezG family protein [Oceanobacillus iheyensis]|uniref:immunity protein YezG family protein n=1 Tax=Oceanobacillus iheyensis TaxID=182710 RepID=UPI003627E95D